MCIRDSSQGGLTSSELAAWLTTRSIDQLADFAVGVTHLVPVSYTHLRAHETVLDLVCRLLLENKNHIILPHIFVVILQLSSLS